MGRKRETQPPIPATTIREHFALRPDGQIVRRDHRLTALAHEPAGYRGADGKLMVGVAYQGRIRRIALLRIAHVLAFGEWPNGQVQPVDGDEWNGAPSNLRVIRRGQNPAAMGASSLVRRAERGHALIMALAAHPDASVAHLGEIVGLSESGACARLGKLAKAGVCISPQCIPGRSWMLSQKGRQFAKASNPVFLDDLDHAILSALAVTPLRQLALSRRLETCSLTIKRRTGLLISRGLVRQAAPRQPFSITDAGGQALGDAAPTRWFNAAKVSAALARDVVQRLAHPNEMSAAERTRLSSLNAQKARANAKARGGNTRIEVDGEFDRMAG
jgi:hypothetical protein